jgi:Tol biopolymer transport system component
VTKLRRRARALSLVTVLGGVLLETGCDDPIAPPATGAIRVVVEPAGQDIIAEGLRVSVGNGSVRPLDSGGFNLTVLGLPPGDHSVRLEGLADNCQVAGVNPRVVTVVSNDTTMAEFTMVCARRVGSVRVTTASAGVDLDPDGYVALVIGGPSQAIPINGTAIIANVREGQQTVTLSGLAPNCAIAGAEAATVSVQYGATANVAFSIECVRFGALEVAVSTTGVELDADGYTVDVRAASARFADALDVAPNASVTFARLRPAADYQVTLQGVAANCDVAGPDAQAVAVVAGGTTSVTFDVSCDPPGLLAFVRESDIYVIRSNGIGATRLTMDPAFDGDPAWSSTGQIAFTTQRHNNDAELYVMNSDGTNQVRITTSAGADDAPSWSPNGGRIVFRSSRDVNSDIYVVNADGTGLTRLTNSLATDYQPAWSGAGKIAFVSDRDHSAGEIYVMNDDGSNVVRLTNNDLPETSPAWSPDGSMIAFARQVECYYGCPQDIFVMNADGSNARRLSTGWATYQYHTDPSWSPNGRTIAFTRQYCDYYDCQAPSVWLVDLQGTQLSQITSNGANPVWKP